MSRAKFLLLSLVFSVLGVMELDVSAVCTSTVSARDGSNNGITASGAPDANQPRTDPKKRKGGPKLPSPQEQYGHFWTLEPGWESILELRNLQQTVLTITPALRTSEGVEVRLPDVALGPDEVQTIDLAQQVRVAAPQLLAKADSYGSAVLRFSAPDRLALYAAVMIRQPGTPISFHVDTALYPGNISRGTRESIWWLPRSEVDGDLIITNFSSTPKPARLVISDSSGKRAETRIALGPRQTYRTTLRYLVQKAKFNTEFGGIQLIPDDQDDSALQLTHFLYDGTTGFSAHMKVLSRGTGSKSGPQVTRAPMMALSQPDPGLGFPEATALRPLIFVRNISAAPVNAQLGLNWLAGAKTGTYSLELTKLAAGETRLIDIAQAQAKDEIPRDAHWATVSLSYNGRRGDLIPVAASYDMTGRYVVQTPFSHSLSYAYKGGMWHVSPAHNTLITAGNGGTKNATVSFGLRFDGGKKFYELPDRDLAPGEQLWVDVGKLINNQVPDKNGLVLPADLQHGSYEFKDVHNPILGYLYEGKLVIDKTFGHATYGCACCCPTYNTWMDPWYVFAPNQTGQASVFAERYCSGTVNVTGNVSSWWTGNGAVGWVSGSGMENATAPGETSVSGVLNFSAPHPESGNCECYEEAYYPESGMTVQPQITSISPPHAMVGKNGVQIQLTGTGFGNSPIVNLPAGFTATGNQVSSNTQITITVDIGVNTTIGQKSISVTANTQTSNSVNFLADGPAYMKMVTDAIGLCSGCTTSVRRTANVQIFNVSGDLPGPISIGEVVTDTGWTCTSPSSAPNVNTTQCGAASLDSNSKFTDGWTFGTDNYSPLGCGWNSASAAWKWCGTGGPSTPRPFGTLSGFFKTTSIRWSGVTRSVPSDPPIPSGTIIYP